MRNFIEFRDYIRSWISTYEAWAKRVLSMLMAFVGILVINSNLGYNEKLSAWYFVLLLTLFAAVLPIKGVGTMLTFIMLIHLYSLSWDVALIGLAFVLICYLACYYFHAENTYNFVTVPIFYGMKCPYAIALGAGLLRQLNELVSVLCGGLTSFFLYTVKTNASAIMDSSTPLFSLTLIKDRMLLNKLLYFYLAALAAMFLIVFVIRKLEINYSWLIAVVSGVAVEFIIMLSGYLMTGNKSAIGSLVLGNIIALVAGLILNYAFLDLDYSRVERVQFEDDDYYYYVTAVPKIHIEAADKEVRRI